jgi:hypothetical protein
MRVGIDAEMQLAPPMARSHAMFLTEPFTLAAQILSAEAGQPKNPIAEKYQGGTFPRGLRCCQGA